LLSLWSDSYRHLRQNSAYAAGYVGCAAVVAAVYRGANAGIAAIFDKDAPPPWLPAFRLGSLLWLAVGAALCAAVFFSLIGRRVDRPLWKCSGWQDGVRRFFLAWFILNLCQIMVIDVMIKLNEAGMESSLPSLLMLDLVLRVFFLPVGACIMYWGRLDWAHLPGVLEPIYAQFLLVIPVLFIGFGQWILSYLGAEKIPTDTGLDILWIGLYDAVLDYISCFAFVMMWRVCMIHRDRSMEGGGNPFDF
jgi:hypothetical protein